MKFETKAKFNKLSFKRQRSFAWLTLMVTLLSIILIQSCDEEENQSDVIITSISPTSGNIRTVVEITGTGFREDVSENEVTLNGKVCPVTSASTTKLTITIPDDGETGNFEVTVGNKTGLSNTFTVIPLAITEINPSSGAVGTLVEITGTGFNAMPSENVVTLNGKVCEVINASITKLTISIPADATSGNLAVTVNAKSVQSGLFNFIPLAITTISPTSGPVGTLVEITGTGFSTTPTENAVTLSGKVCPIINASITKLTIGIPADATSGNLTVTVKGKSVQSAAFTFIPLTITGISPTSGEVGTMVAITGTGFSTTASANAVTLNGIVCPVVTATATNLSVTIPTTATTGNLVVTVSEKTVQSGVFTVVAGAPDLVISSISPNTGGKNTVVTITGTGFSATASANAVTLNGKTCPVINATITALTITIPAEAGSGNITVAVNGKAAQTGTFTFIPDPPAITSISPTTGPKNTVVTITGTGFSAIASENAVTLNSKVCPVTIATTTTLTITIPADAGSGNIVVTIGGNTTQSGLFTFIPDSPPPLAITSISPNTGPKNTVVTITGTGFSATPSENDVTLNSKVCPVTSATTTTLTITIPADAGTGNIAVTVAGNTAQSDTFTFIPDPLSITSISPTTGPKNTVVTITGTGFSATASQNTVTLNGNVCPVTNATTTSLTITIPANAGSGNIIVTVGASTAQSSTFTFIPDPPALAITSIAPTTGPKNTVVTITGTGFSTTAANNDVTLNNKVCSVTSATETQLVVTIPAGAGSGVIKVTKDATTVQSQTFDFVFTITVSTFAGSDEGSADGNGTAAQFKKPADAVFDASGNLYVTDGDNHKIRKITPAGVVSTFAGSSYGYADGAANSAQFQFIKGIDIDANNNLYVADENSQRIRKITQAGVVSTLAGSGSEGSSDNVIGTSAEFRYPTGVAVDGSGNVYVADKDNHRIRKISTSSQVTTFAGSSEGSADGNGTSAQFKKPFDAVFDASGNMYVTDSDNHKIRKITPAGEVSTFAGSTYGFEDGPGNTAKFQFIKGIAIDANGNLYVADENSHRIRKITPSGFVTTLAGNGNEGFANGAGSAAEFRYPTGVAVDNSGNVYVADKDNHKIRKITID